MSEDDRPAESGPDRIRGVLVRAAREQAGEQHQQAVEQHQQAIEQVQGSLDTLEQVLAAVSGRQGGTEERLDALADQLEEMARQEPPGWAQRLDSKLNTACGQAHPMDELAPLSADVRGAAHRLATALSRIGSVTTSAEQTELRFRGLRQRLDRLQTSTDSITDGAARLEETLTSVGERAEHAHQQLDQRLQQTLERLDRRQEQADGRLDAGLDELDGHLERVEERTTGLTGRADRMPTGLRATEIHHRLADLDQHCMPEHSQQLASLEEHLETADSHLKEALAALGRELRATGSPAA